MRTFKNIFDIEISIKPFYHNVCEVWRVARYENNKLSQVYESKGYEKRLDCVIACQEYFDKISQSNDSTKRG